MCKISANRGIKGNKIADVAAEERIDMPGTASTKLNYTGYKLQMAKGVRKQYSQITLNQTSQEWKSAQNSCRQ